MAGDAPRVRFAPSPTGYFHVGSARTALFNWLVARQSGGTFILRIEDTDAERGREEWVDGIISAMHWLSMDPDEGPFRQSQRTGRYHQAIDALWDAGRLYACDCTREEIDARNKAAGIHTPGYDGFCRSRGLPGEGHALRFRTPDDGVTTVHDVIRGPVEFPCAAMDDFVAVKATGAPLFVLANVVDDIDMAITHVIRGEDLLPTTPEGCWSGRPWSDWVGPTDGVAGTEGGPAPGLPVFAHLPMLVNEQRKKLSKRRDPVAVESYRDQGYLPDAFVNYLALLGWSPPGGEELFDTEPDGGVVPAGGRQPLAGLLRRGQADPHERRVHPGHAGRRVHRGVPALGGRGTGPRGRPRASTPWSSPPWPPWSRSGSPVLSEVPAMVDFLFLRRAGDRRGVVGQGSGRRRVGRPRCWRRPSGPTGRWSGTGTVTPSTPPRWPSGRGWGASWARPRRPSGWPSPDDGWDCRCSSPSRSWVPTGPWIGWSAPWGGRHRARRDGRGAVGAGDRGGPAAVGLIATVTGWRLLRFVLRMVALVVLVVAVYLAVTAVQVWLTSRRYQPRPAGAIVVMGAAQYDGVPSPDLRARLDEAGLLWHQGFAKTVVVTGSKEPGDRFTEAQAGARYLVSVARVPPHDIVEAGGSDSWGNLADAVPTLVARGDTTVLVVTDPFHEARSLAIASSLHLDPWPTPTRTSPIAGTATLPYFAKETVGVALGRIIGFDHLTAVHSSLGSIGG